MTSAKARAPARARALVSAASARARALVSAASAAMLVASPALARALDKQGSAHAGEVEGQGTGFGVSGSLMLGSSLYNPSYAARPDNSGLALFRYAGHADLDLIGRSLSVPIDVNMFTDRTRSGAAVFVPSELDLIGGLTSTFGAGPGALELGARVETDRTVSGGAEGATGATQTYADVRARYLYRLSALWPELSSALAGGDIGGWATLGWFAYNPSYFSRPNNTGNALLRYALHAEASGWDGRVTFALDATFFTDRDDHPLRPSELDLTPELIFRAEPLALHLAYERDMPVGGDGGGPHVVQNYVYALLAYDFELLRNGPSY